MKDSLYTHERRVLDLYDAGKSQRQISNELGMAREKVGKIIAYYAGDCYQRDIQAIARGSKALLAAIMEARG